MRRRKCPISCQCVCHDTGGGDYGEHGPNGGPCPGKVPVTGGHSEGGDADG